VADVVTDDSPFSKSYGCCSYTPLLGLVFILFLVHQDHLVMELHLIFSHSYPPESRIFL
jgi:hypothetical protein